MIRPAVDPCLCCLRRVSLTIDTRRTLVQEGTAPGLELAQHLWRPGLIATSEEEWAAMQRALTTADAWIIDGYLDPGNVPAVRLRGADAILVPDDSLLRCVARMASRPEKGRLLALDAHLAPQQACPAGHHPLKSSAPPRRSLPAVERFANAYARCA